MDAFKLLYVFLPGYALAFRESSFPVFTGHNFKPNLSVAGCSVTVQFKLNECSRDGPEGITVNEKMGGPPILLCSTTYVRGTCSRPMGCNCNSNPQVFAFTKVYDAPQSLEWEVVCKLKHKSTLRKTSRVTCFRSSQNGTVTESEPALSTQISDQWNATGTDEVASDGTDEVTLVLIISGAVLFFLLTVATVFVICRTLNKKRGFQTTNAQYHLPNVIFQPQQPAQHADTCSHASDSFYEEI